MNSAVLTATLVGLVACSAADSAFAAKGRRRARWHQPCQVDNRPPDTEPAARTGLLPWGDVQLSLKITSFDERGLPSEVGVGFRNLSTKRGFLTLPKGYTAPDDAMPVIALAIGVREEEDRGEPIFLYVQNSQPSAERLLRVDLVPGQTVYREYDCRSFCLIGHGVGPDPAANFSTCYRPGKARVELRAYLFLDLSRDFTRLESNPIVLHTSRPDLSIHPELKSTSPTP